MGTNDRSITLPDMSAHRVVIAGGTGNVGEGVVRAWLRAGAEVVVPSRGAAKQQALRNVLADEPAATHARLHLVDGPYTTFADAESMAERITTEFGEVTDVVASIGGWWQGKPLWQIEESDWQRFFVDLVTAHVATARAWVPRLPATGSYQLILGGSATQPVPGAAMINMEQAALLMMRSVLAAEVGDQRRIAAQILGPVASRSRPWVDPAWITNDEVGAISVGIAATSTVAAVDLDLHTEGQIDETLALLGLTKVHG